jgi:trimeric autotransporter adhesin
MYALFFPIADGSSPRCLQTSRKFIETSTFPFVLLSPLEIFCRSKGIHMSSSLLRSPRAEHSEMSRQSRSHISSALFVRCSRAAAISLASFAAIMTVSCGSHSSFLPSPSGSGASFRGHVQGGQNPITGSTIQLYAVGTTADFSLATPLLTSAVTTDSSGDFSITGDYTCPSATANVYLASTGGNPGLAPGTNNANISMVAALGACGTLSSSTYVVVNEATTIASIYPFLPYMASYSLFGSGPSDAAALNTAFATVNEFVDTTNGTSPGPDLPPGDGADTAKLYTLSDIVATCINSAGGVAGDGSPCGNFFTDATPPSGTPPTDIVGALLDIANNPNNNVMLLYSLVPSDGPFQPILPVAPSDWTLAIEPTITIALPSTLVGNGNTLTGTVTLSGPVPTSPVTVDLVSSQPGFVTVGASLASTSVTIAAGTSSQNFTYEGVTGGTSVIDASATGYIDGTASVTSTASLISLGTIPTLAPGQTVSLALSLGTPAPAGGVTVNFSSGNNAIASVSPTSVFIAAGLTVPTANPQITGGAMINSTTITASATGYALDVANVNVTVTAAFNPSTISEPLNTPTNLNLTISAPAPTGGITFNLSSSSADATVGATAMIAAGATSVAVPVTGVTAGTVTVSAMHANINTATATVNIGGAISVSSATIGQFMQGSINVSLATTPTAPITVTVTSGIPGAVLLSKSSTTGATLATGTTLTFTNVTTTNVGTVYVQGQGLGAGNSGSSTITAIASSGYANGTGTVTVMPSGFVIYPSQGNISTTTLSPPTSVTLEPAILTSALAYYNSGQLNPGIGPFYVPMTSSVPADGTISSSVTFNGGDSSDTASFTPIAVTPSPITLSIQAPPTTAFSTPTNYQSITATITAPTITVSGTTIGQFMQGSINVSLQTAPVVPITVTVTSGTPGAVLLSKSSTTGATLATGTTLTFTSVTSTNVGTIYVQGQGLGAGASGSSVITASATITSNGNPSGYTPGMGTVTVMPSGFVIYPSQGNISTTTLSPPTNVTLEPAILTSGLAYYNSGQLNPGIGPFYVPMASSVPAEGTISSSVTFNGGDTSDTASFTPIAATTSPITLSIQAPPTTAFSTPTNYQSITATITAPTITVSSTTIGQFMQGSINVSLQTAPMVPINVTVSLNGVAPYAVLLSKSATTAATVMTGTTLTFTNVTTASVGTIYVQGQGLPGGAGTSGSSTITASATIASNGNPAGYTPGMGTVTVMPSGFVIYPSQGNITTTTFSTPTTVTLEPAILTSGLAYYNSGQLNPGIGPFNVYMTSSTPADGTISSPVVFNGGDSSDSASFTPVAATTSPITIGITSPTPAGFSTPTNYQSITATVTAPNATIGSATVGANMQGAVNVSLATAPPSAVTVTVTTNGPGIATISKSATVAGGTSLTFTNVTSTNVGTIYVQGQTVGTTTVTVAAPGYNNGNGNVTVMPSGFVIYPSQGNITTTTLSTPTTVTLEPAILNPGVLTFYNSGQLNPGIGPFTVAVNTSPTPPTIGTITTNPVQFNPGDSSDVTSFQPVAQGSTTLSLGAPMLAMGGTMPPTAFVVPSQYQSISATVTAPNITIGNATVGANMQGPINVSLGTAPQVPMNVTVSVNGSAPFAVLLSKSATVGGTNSVTFTSVTSTNVGTVYVQGQSIGSATLTASAVITSSGASGTYNNGTATITVDPSGFVIYPSQGNITTTTFSPPTTVTLEPAILNPSLLTFYNSGQLNPGIGPFDVPVTISASTPAGVGSITTSPVIFNPGDSSDATSFQPLASGTATVSVGSPTLAAGGTMPPTAFSVPSQYQSISATVTAPNINLGSTTVGEYMQGPISVGLAVTPQVPVNVTVTINSGSVPVYLSSSPGTVGASSITFTSVTSTNIGTIYVQGQGTTGTATLTANATNTSNGNPAGYNAGTGTITVDPSGFVIYPSQGNIAATPQSSPTTITLEPAILNPGILTYYNSGTLDPNVSYNLTISSSNTNVGTLSPTTVSFPLGGSSSATTVFQPGNTTGPTTIAITDPQAAPFNTPSQYQSIMATVTAPNINIGNTTTGVSLQTAVGVSLGATPLTPVNVTITSNNPSIATVSNSASTVGQNSITFTNVTSTNVGTIYVQGQSVGPATLTASATNTSNGNPAGYNNGTGTVTVDPSGFVIYPSQGNISTTPTSPATTVTLEPAILDPGILTFIGTAELNPNIGPFDVAITSSNTNAGTITTSPVVFHGGDQYDSTSFQPANAGTTVLALGAQPGGFSTPTDYQQITANVVAMLSASVGNVTTGVNIETPVGISLGTAPTSPGITVTVSITNGTGSANVSGSSSAAGAAGVPVTFNNVTSTSVGTVWVQGLTPGAATITVTPAAGSGYSSGMGTVTIDPSGFVITSGSFSTTTFSPPTTIDLQPAILNPDILTVYSYGQLTPGIGQFTIELDGDDALVGNVTSPVTFNGGDTLDTSSFTPVGAGPDTLTLGPQPFAAGFSTPSQQQYTQITATVVAPSSNVNNVVTGVNLEAPTYIELGAAPSGSVTLNVSIANSPGSAGPNVAAISSSPIVAGGQNLMLPATTSTVGPIYVQGLNQGTAIITVTPGSEYASSTGTVTVDPAGFIISSGNIVTTPTSAPTQVTITPAVLTPGLLTFYSYGQLSPTAPGPFPYQLTLTSGNGNVGTISTSPVNLNAGDTSDSSTFVPVGAGPTTVTLGAQPGGFGTPSQPQYTQISAIVVAPDGSSIGNATTGVNMQVPVDVYLGSAPSTPISVTVTSLDSTVATVSPSASTAGASVAGQSSYTFPSVSSAFVGTVYIQGQTVGTATLQVTNSGAFTTGTGTATVNPSGFVINSGNILTTLASTPTVMVVPAVLNPGVLTLYSYGQLNPGIGPYSLDVTSENAAIGTISVSPVMLGGDATSASTNFQPVAAGTTDIDLPSVPPASGLPGTFSTPSQYQQITATVTAPGITVGNVVTGVNMENPLVGITLSVAPLSPITVTVTSNGPSIALVSNGSSVAGSPSITIPNVSTTNVGTIWIQGQSADSTTITVSAPGYTSGIGLATVDPSGFVFQTGNFATTSSSPPTTIPIYAAVLDPATLDYVGSAQLNPGLSVTVPLTSSMSATIGSISSSVDFTAEAASENATFTPNPTGNGDTTLMIQTPTGATGFSTPSQTAAQQIIATVVN